MQISVSHSLPGSTIILFRGEIAASGHQWRTLQLITSHVQRPSRLYSRPLTFCHLYVIIDVPSCVSPDKHIAVFADDDKLYKTMSSIDEQVVLQNDFNALSN